MEWVIEMSRFQITEEEYKAIEAKEKEVKDKHISRRLRVLMLKYEGYKLKEIADKTGMNKSSVCVILRRYREQGLEEFARNKYTSHWRALTEEQEKEILGQFEKAAESGREVTAQEIKAALDEARGKDTGIGYVYRVLKRHGWRKVMPRSKHPKAASEEACEASKKLSKAYWKPEKTCPLNSAEECD